MFQVRTRPFSSQTYRNDDQLELLRKSDPTQDWRKSDPTQDWRKSDPTDHKTGRGPRIDDIQIGGFPEKEPKLDTRPKPQPTPKSTPRPEVERKMYDFGRHDASKYGDGVGFGLADVRHMREQGASEENIGKFARDYQASGGKVGDRAAGIYGMKGNQGGPIAGSNAQKFLGDWWTKREGGKAPEVKYDYASHNTLDHGDVGIGIRDMEYMRNSGASDENIKKYIRDYRSQGGVVGAKAASFAGIAQWSPAGIRGPNSITPGDWYHQTHNNDSDPQVDINTNNEPVTSGSNNVGTEFVQRFAGDFMDDTSGFDTSKEYIAESRANPVINRTALDKRIHERPLYHGAQSDISRSETFGDQWTGKQPPEFVWPGALKPIEAPDLDIDKYLDMIDDIG